MLQFAKVTLMFQFPKVNKTVISVNLSYLKGTEQLKLLVKYIHFPPAYCILIASAAIAKHMAVESYGVLPLSSFNRATSL